MRATFHSASASARWRQARGAGSRPAGSSSLSAVAGSRCSRHRGKAGARCTPGRGPRFNASVRACTCESCVRCTASAASRNSGTHTRWSDTRTNGGSTAAAELPPEASRSADGIWHRDRNRSFVRLRPKPRPNFDPSRIEPAPAERLDRPCRRYVTRLSTRHLRGMLLASVSADLRNYGLAAAHLLPRGPCTRATDNRARD